MSVKVRLVLKKSAHELRTPSAMSTLFSNAVGETNASTDEISINAFQKAERKVDGRVKLTNLKRLEMELEEQDIGTVFKVKPRTVSEKVEEGERGIKITPSFITSDEALQVPDELRDEVAFAYLPTPPTYHSETPVAPKVSLHHLTLGEVRRTLGAAKCHRRGWTGKGVHVAMIDSGFASHPFFSQGGFNYKAVATPQQPNPMLDPSGHGSGESANIFAMAPDIEFSGIRFGGSSAADIESAIDLGADIITNSWGWNADTQSWAELASSAPNLYYEFRDMADLIEEATMNGIVVIFSAGNGHYAFPGSHPDVLSAGGVTVSKSGVLSASSYASSFMSKLYPGRAVPDLCGIVGEFATAPMPGHIMLPVPNGCKLEGENLPINKSALGWGIFSGTSAAAPQMAGAIALMMQARKSANLPPMTPADIKSILKAQSVDVVSGRSAMDDNASLGVDLATGTGLMDTFGACIAATNQ